MRINITRLSYSAAPQLVTITINNLIKTTLMTLMLDLCAERVPEGGWSRVAIDNASDDNTLTD